MTDSNPIPRALVWPSQTWNTTREDEREAAWRFFRELLSADRPTEAPTDHPNPETGAEGVTVDLGATKIAGWIPNGPDDPLGELERMGALQLVDGWKIRLPGPPPKLSGWPPPKPGTHESDLCDQSLRDGGAPKCRPCLSRNRIELRGEFAAARDWSEANRTTP